MSWTAWGPGEEFESPRDGVDPPDGYVTEDCADEMVAEACDALAKRLGKWAAWFTLAGIVAGLVVGYLVGSWR